MLGGSSGLPTALSASLGEFARGDRGPPAPRDVQQRAGMRRGTLDTVTEDVCVIVVVALVAAIITNRAVQRLRRANASVLEAQVSGQAAHDHAWRRAQHVVRQAGLLADTRISPEELRQQQPQQQRSEPRRHTPRERKEVVTRHLAQS